MSTDPGDTGGPSDVGDVGDVSGERLPCGASSDGLLTQVAEGRADRRDAHQRGCVHCQAALGEYARLWGPMQQLAEVPVEPPPDMLGRALAGLRRVTAPPGMGRVEDRDGAFLVAARAVVTVAGHTARATAGVRIALSSLGTLSPHHTDTARAGGAAARVGVSGHSVAVELKVAADYGQDLHALAGRLRARVTDAVAIQLGLRTVEVTVEITDVFLPRDPR